MNSIGYPLNERGDDHFVAGGRVPERRHVRGTDQADQDRHRERQAAEHVRGHPAHCRQAPDLPRELLALADCLRDHVEEAGERAADLPLDGHGVEHE
jgi:hypothetical protein